MQFTSRELAQVLGVNRSTIVRRAEKESWPFTQVNGRGDRRYDFDSLPRDVQGAVMAHEAKKAIEDLPEASPSSFDGRPYPELVRRLGRECYLPMWSPQPGAPALPPTLKTLTLSPKRQDEALAKAQLINQYLKAVGEWGSKEHNRRRFMQAYNSGIAFPELFEKLGRTSWQTIERWIRQLKQTGDCFTLADNRGRWRRGQISLTEEQKKIVLRCALSPNKPFKSEAIRLAISVMHFRGIPNGRNESTYRRFLDWWEANNYHIWTFIREGEKAWNDKCAVDIERDMTLINVGDVIVADGHDLNFEILNPWTGRPARMTLILWYDMRSNYPLGWEIDPTENTQAISSALFRAIITLGKTPQVAYLDNGKAFGSRFFNGQDLSGFGGAFSRLNIKTVFAWPYHAQSKTVERFFSTFAEFERLCPTYTGTSIENKPPRLMRGEKLHRKLHDKLTGGECLSLEQAHRAIAAFLDDYARRPQRGHLEGASPLEVFQEGKGPGVDADEIRWLLMGITVRRIRKSQITLFGRSYYAPELYGLKKTVVVRYDLQDPSAVYIYEENGDDFICTAPLKIKCHPSATHLGDDSDREQLSAWIETKHAQKKEAGGLARDILDAEVIPETRRRLAEIGYGAEGTPGRTGKGKKVVMLPEPIDEEALNLEVERRLAEGAADRVRSMWREVETAGEVKRYELLIDIEARGILIPQQWRQFMNYFENTPAYSRYADFYAQLRAEAAVKYQREEEANAD